MINPIRNEFRWSLLSVWGEERVNLILKASHVMMSGVSHFWCRGCLIFLAMWLAKTQVSGSGSGDVARVRKAQRQYKFFFNPLKPGRSLLAGVGWGGATKLMKECQLQFRGWTSIEREFTCKKLCPNLRKMNVILRFETFAKLRFCLDLAHKNSCNSLNFLDRRHIFWI